MSYCPKCGGTGVLLDGSPCDCKTRESDLFADVVCLEIPETYRGIRFDPLMLPSSMGPVYRAYMGDLYSQITSLRYKCKNTLICSPQQTGKSVMAYSTIQELFRRNIPVFPLYDLLEIKRMMLDLEYGKSKSLDADNILDLYSVPYLFAYIPAILNYDVFDSAALLISRRVRRGNSTILLYEGNWSYLSAADQKGSLKNMKGSGALTTIEVNSWSSKEA